MFRPERFDPEYLVAMRARTRLRFNSGRCRASVQDDLVLEVACFACLNERLSTFNDLASNVPGIE